MIDKLDKQKILKIFNTNNSEVVSVTQVTAYTNYKDPVSDIFSKHTPIQAHLPAILRCQKSLKPTVDQRNSYRISYTTSEFLVKTPDKLNQKLP